MAAFSSAVRFGLGVLRKLLSESGPAQDAGCQPEDAGHPTSRRPLWPRGPGPRVASPGSPAESLAPQRLGQDVCEDTRTELWKKDRQDSQCREVGDTRWTTPGCDCHPDDFWKLPQAQGLMVSQHIHTGAEGHFLHPRLPVIKPLSLPSKRPGLC